MVGRVPQGDAARTDATPAFPRRAHGIIHRRGGQGCVRPGRIECPNDRPQHRLATWLGVFALALLAAGLVMLAAS